MCLASYADFSVAGVDSLSDVGGFVSMKVGVATQLIDLLVPKCICNNLVIPNYVVPVGAYALPVHAIDMAAHDAYSSRPTRSSGPVGHTLTA